MPSNAVNATEMWLEFDAATINRERGFAEGLALNGIRVFIQYVVFEHDAAGLLERFDALLELASRHGLSVYNEPRTRRASLTLLHDAFASARQAAPSQPLTAGWSGALLSDLTAIHFYVSPTRRPAEARLQIESAKSYGTPVVVTEALGWPNHGELHEILPLFAEHRIGWYLWELMIGVDQTRYQWPGSPHAAETIVFQGLLYPDGTPYSGEEVELIRAQVPGP